jgi:hypothetical protein
MKRRMSILRNVSMISARKLREAVALELTAEEEAEEEEEMSILRNGSSIFSHEAEKTATWEVAEEARRRRSRQHLLC